MGKSPRVEGREATKGLVEDAQGPGRLLACCSHIVVGRAEACLTTRCMCLACEVDSAECVVRVVAATASRNHASAEPTFETSRIALQAAGYEESCTVLQGGVVAVKRVAAGPFILFRGGGG